MHRVRKPSFQSRRTISAWVISVASLILGAWISTFGNEIKTASALFYHNLFSWRGLGPDLETIAFYLTFAVWGVALLVRLLADDKQEWIRRERLMQAIHRVPNFDVIQDYPGEVRKLIAVLIVGIDESLSDDARMVELEVRIRSVLRSIAMMAQSYAHRERIRYGANIMLVVQAKEAPGAIFDSLKFHDPSNRDALQALLYLPPGLLVADVNAPVGEQGARQIPLIALPVRRPYPDGSREVLPGAPFALVHGELSVYEDTRLLAEECKDFAKKIKDDVQTYFGDDGEGRSIRSLAALRIGDASQPLGVLNIDSEGEHVLGREPEYYPTFHALVEPLLAVMAPLVEDYAELLWKKLSSKSVEQSSSIAYAGTVMKPLELAKKLLTENQWGPRPERPAYIRKGSHVIVGSGGTELREDFLSAHRSKGENKK